MANIAAALLLFSVMVSCQFNSDQLATGSRRINVAFLLDSACVSPSMFRLQKETVKFVLTVLNLLDSPVRASALHVSTKQKGNLSIAEILCNFDQSKSAAEFKQMINGASYKNPLRNIDDVPNFLMNTVFSPSNVNQSADDANFLLLFADGCNYEMNTAIAQRFEQINGHVMVVFMAGRTSFGAKQSTMEAFYKTYIASGEDMLFYLKKNTELSDLAESMLVKIKSRLTTVYAGHRENRTESDHHSGVESTEEPVENLVVEEERLLSVPIKVEEETARQVNSSLEKRLKKLLMKTGIHLRPNVKYVAPGDLNNADVKTQRETFVEKGGVEPEREDLHPVAEMFANVKLNEFYFALITAGMLTMIALAACGYGLKQRKKRIAAQAAEGQVLCSSSATTTDEEGSSAGASGSSSKDFSFGSAMEIVHEETVDLNHRRFRNKSMRRRSMEGRSVTATSTSFTSDSVDVPLRVSEDTRAVIIRYVMKNIIMPWAKKNPKTSSLKTAEVMSDQGA